MRKIITTLALLLTMATQAAIYTDQATHVRYKYEVGQPEATVIEPYEDTDLEGDITILSHFTVDGNTYTVTTINRYAMYEEDITHVTIPSTVKTIGESAFARCEKLQSVSLAEGLVTIGDHAFYGCEKLKNISIPSTVIYLSGFDGCRLTSIDIPANVTSIGGSAFSGCSGLTSIDIPANVTSIGGSAFSGCSGLTSIDIPANVTSIGGSAFSGCGIKSITIPETVSELNTEGLFSGCTELQDVKLPEILTEIGDYMFNNCFSLKNLDFLPSGITTIGCYAFSECIGLETANLPAGLISIGEDAFLNCIALKDVFLPFVQEYHNAFSGCDNVKITLSGGNVTKIPDEAYKYEDKIINVLLPPSVVSIGNRAFVGTSLTAISLPDGLESVGEGAFMYCQSLEKVSMTNSVTHIGQEAFYGCSTLKEITLSATVEEMEENVFEECYGYAVSFPDDTSDLSLFEGSRLRGMTAITIPEGITEVSSLSGCHSLKSVSLPSTLKTISEYAFYYCTSLESINLPQGLRRIGNYAFSDCGSLTALVIPASVEEIGNGIISNCPSVESLSVREGNKYFDSRNDCNAIIQTETNDLFAGCRNTVIPDDVRSILEGAFSSIDGMTVNLPENIQLWVFTNCRNLNITIPAKCGVGSFDECYNVNVTYAEGCTTIPQWSFYRDNGLVSVTLPSTLTHIDQETFTQCHNLFLVISHIAEPFEIADGTFSLGFTDEDGYRKTNAVLCVPAGSREKYLSTKGWDIFDNIVETDPTFIGEYVDPATNVKYRYIEGVQAASVTPGIYDEREDYRSEQDVKGDVQIVPQFTVDGTTYTTTAIGCGAFRECDITGIIIPSTVKVIGENAFEDCRGLKSVVMPTELGSIESNTFHGCEQLSEISIPNKVTEIGHNAFDGCNSLAEVTLPDGLLSIGYSAFRECPISSIVIPASVNEIGESAFYSWDESNELNVILAEGRTSIPDKMFSGSNCTNLVLPQSLTSIGQEAFRYCRLTSVTIPAGVISIGNLAFSGCGNLNTVVSLIENPFEIDSSVFCLKSAPGFSIAYDAVLYVPEGTLTKYQATPAWNEFQNIHEGNTSVIKDITSMGSERPSKTADRYTIDGKKVTCGHRGVIIVTGRKIIER